MTRVRLSIALSILSIFSIMQPALAGDLPPYPPSAVHPVVDTLHGVAIVDNYRWLEDQNSPETRAWIDAQNAYTRKVLDQIPGREKIAARYKELIKLDRMTVSAVRGNRYFISKRKADQQLWMLYYRDGVDGEDKVLLDPNTMSADLSLNVDLEDVTTDGRLMAYGVRHGGEDELVYRFMQVDSRRQLEDSLPKARYSGVYLSADGLVVYYCRYSDEKGPRVYQHRLGSEAVSDTLIFGEQLNPQNQLALGVSDDARWLTATIYEGSSGVQTQVFVKDLSKAEPFQPIVTDIKAEFFPDAAGNTLYLQTSLDADRWRILAVDLANPAQANWKEVVPQDSGTITGFNLIGGNIHVQYLTNACSQVKVYTPEGKLVREWPLPTIGSVSSVVGEWSKSEFFYSFASFHFPSTIFRADISTGAQRIFSEAKVPVNTDEIEVKQVWFTSKDGTKVPMFLAYKKGLILDGQRPVEINGYGGFNNPEKPYFTSTAVIFIEHGGVYALANLRGGGEFGDAWHKAAMFEKKQNTFDDLIAAAEWLIANKYTNPSKLEIQGGSNGGLLVGAVMNQRPDLFQAIICTYPLLDMLRYQKLLVGRFWVSEYGSADSVNQFPYIRAYSPYHNVRTGVDYPAVLFVTGDGDTRVAPAHARKMTALMQAMVKPTRPVLLLYDTKLGHSGGATMDKSIADATDVMAFRLWQLGVPL